MLPVIYRAAAEEELREAIAGNEGVAPGLAAEFIRCIDARLELIRRYPEIFPVVHRGIRRGVIRRFPYAIFYLPTKDAIIVLSIFHSSRDPRIWRRLDSSS